MGFLLIYRIISEIEIFSSSLVSEKPTTKSTYPSLEITLYMQLALSKYTQSNAAHLCGCICLCDKSKSFLIVIDSDLYWYCYREYLVDLIGNPGCLCEPDSLLNGPSSISISSPLRLPRFRQVDATIDFRSQAKQYFSDCQSLNLVFDDSSTGDHFFILKIPQLTFFLSLL